MQLLVEHHQRQQHGIDDARRVVARPLRLVDVVLERVDVDQRQDGAVDPVVERLVGPDLHPVPAAVAVLDLGLAHRDRLDHLGDLLVQIGHVDVELDVVDAGGRRRRRARSGCCAPSA